jgi:hypothetical protein
LEVVVEEEGEILKETLKAVEEVVLVDLELIFLDIH